MVIFTLFRLKNMKSEKEKAKDGKLHDANYNPQLIAERDKKD